MKRKGIWLVISVLVVLGLLLGGFGCKAPAPTPTPTPTPTPAKPTPTPAKPTPTPTPTPTPPPSPAKPEVIKWIVQNQYYIGSPYEHFDYNTSSNVSGRAIEFLEDLGAGRLEIDWLEPNTIVPSLEVMSAVGRGTIDAACHCYGGYWSREIPELDVEVGLPFAWESPEEVWDALTYYGLRDELEKLYEEYNIHWIPLELCNMYNIGTTFPISTSADLEGKKIRVGAAIYGDLLSALGAMPTVVPSPDIYMALKLGTLDCIQYNPTGLEGNKFKEVLTHWVVSPNFNPLVTSFLINLDRWNELPEDIRYMFDKYAFSQMWGGMDYLLAQRYMLAAAEEEYGIELVYWPEDDIAKVREIGIELWDTVAAKNERCARMVESVKKQARRLGKIE